MTSINFGTREFADIVPDLANAFEVLLGLRTRPLGVRGVSLQADAAGASYITVYHIEPWLELSDRA